MISFFYDLVADGKEIDNVSVCFAKSYCSQHHLVLPYLKCRTLYDFILFAFFVSKVREVPGDYFIFFFLFFLRHRCRHFFFIFHLLLFLIALSYKSYLFLSSSIVIIYDYAYVHIHISSNVIKKKTNALIMRNEK